MTENTPRDLITIRDASKMVGKSRSWIEARVQVYRVGRADMVSASAVQAANEQYNTPQPKPREG